MHTFINFSYILFYYRLLQDIEYNSLCYSVGSCWLFIFIYSSGVPAVAQWVRNLTKVAQVAVETQVRSSSWYSGLKDPELPQLWCRLQLWLRFNPWPGNFHMLQERPYKNYTHTHTHTTLRHNIIIYTYYIYFNSKLLIYHPPSSPLVAISLFSVYESNVST